MSVVDTARHKGNARRDPFGVQIMIAAACAYSLRSGTYLKAESDGVRKSLDRVLVARQEMPAGRRLTADHTPGHIAASFVVRAGESRVDQC